MRKNDQLRSRDNAARLLRRQHRKHREAILFANHALPAKPAAPARAPSAQAEMLADYADRRASVPFFSFFSRKFDPIDWLTARFAPRSEAVRVGAAH